MERTYKPTAIAEKSDRAELGVQLHIDLSTAMLIVKTLSDTAARDAVRIMDENEPVALRAMLRSSHNQLTTIGVEVGGVIAEYLDELPETNEHAFTRAAFEKVIRILSLVVMHESVVLNELDLSDGVNQVHDLQSLVELDGLSAAEAFGERMFREQQGE